MKKHCMMIAAALAVANAATADAQPPAKPYGDADGDGLSNVAEWLIGNVFTNFPGTAGISATNAYSLTALMPDYYRRVENLYLGEMFADHDFMEDGWEDKYKTTARSLYDPWNDPDGDGWSNYAECRAGTDPGDEASRPAPTIRATVSMAPGEGQLAGKIVLEAYGTEPIDPAGRAEAKWTVETSGVTRAEFRIDGRGVRGGRHVFAAWLDKDGNGKWDPGEPYGAAKDVDVGWSDAEFTVELTQTTPIMARIDIATAIGNGSVTTFETADGASDRGNVNSIVGYYKNKAIEDPYEGTNMPPNSTSLTRIRVVRNWINGEYHRQGSSSTYAEVILDRYFDLSVHPTLTEADLLADGAFDLDWDTLYSARGLNRILFNKQVYSATYRVVVGDGEIGDQAQYASGKNLPVLFSNRFEYNPDSVENYYQTPTVPCTNYTAQLIYPSRPTFCWTHTNTIDKAYPAFQLRIYRDAEKRSIVYDSGIQRAPARDQNGMYRWTAPVYADMVSVWKDSSGVKHATMFTTTNNYYWAVSMLDAKFTTFSPQETVTPFRLGTSGSFADGHGHGSIAVRVKYMGALYGSVSMNPASMAGVTNLVRVQAFTTPDFTGLPVAETYVTNVATIASESVIATNAVLRGVAPGTYYVRAYIDTDADGVKSDWESWGYNCYVGDRSVERAWAPKPITLKCNLNPPPDATVYIEDADTDNDGFPDAWEWNQYGDLATQGPATGNTAFPTVNPSLSPTLNN